MSITDGTRVVTATGDVVERAISAPLREAPLKERLAKMGNTLLSLQADDIELELDEGANLSVGAINALRRAAAEKFESQRRNVASIEREVAPRVKKTQPFKSALFMDGDMLSELAPELLSGFDAVFAPLFAADCAFELANGAYLPPILLDSDFPRVKKRLDELRKMGVMYTLVGNLSQIGLSLEQQMIPVADIRMNVTNALTKEALRELGVEHAVLSAELDLPKARDIGGAVTAYGRIPLMITERCFTKEIASCAECGKAALRDRRGKSFPLIKEYEHRTLVLNSEITYMLDRANELYKNGLSMHFIFTVEKAAEVRRVLSALGRREPIEQVFRGEKPRRLGMRSMEISKEKSK